MKTTRVQLNCHGVNSEHSHEHTNILCLTMYVILENVKTRFLNFEKNVKYVFSNIDLRLRRSPY